MDRAGPARLLPRLIVAIAIAAALLLAMLAALPFDRFKPSIEARLSAKLGTPVTIARLRRIGRLSLVPEIAIEGLRVAQPSWAGSGDRATVRSLTLRLPLVPALLGDIRPRAMAAAGVRILAIRTAGGRFNWPDNGGGGRSSPLPFDRLRVTDARIVYRDALRNRSADLAFAYSPERGLVVTGSGTVLGAPVRIAASGAALVTGRPWPFRATITGPTLDIAAAGTTDLPLDIAHASFDAHVRADNLLTADAVIVAGLFATQPIDINARVRRDASKWTVTALAGTVGSARISGHGSVDRRDGRSIVDATIAADHFAFDDLETDAGIAAASASEARIGRRLLPDTRIALDRLGSTDGVLRVSARGMHGSGSPPISGFDAVLTLDHQLLAADPLRVTLTRGVATGHASVDQRGGRSEPRLDVDLAIRSTTLTTLVGAAPIDGDASGRVRLAGSGNTVRAAIGRASGSIGLVARNGTLPARLASLLGFDLGRGLTADSGAEAGLRCAVLRLVATHGQARADPLIVDTTRARTDGSGIIDLATERLALRVTGAPKAQSLLRLPGTVTIGGTIRDPEVTLPPHAKSVGTILKAIARAIDDRQGAIAANADCSVLARRALG